MIKSAVQFVLISLLFTGVLTAAWEDDSTAPAPRRTSTAVTSAAPRPSAATGTVPADLYSQFLDTPVDPVYWTSLAYVAPAEFEAGDDASMVELDGSWKLAVYRDVLQGDVDLNLRLHSVIFAGDGGYDFVPAVLIALPFDAGWTWRFVEGTSFELRAKPGIYADVAAFGADMFSLPFSLAWYRSVSPTLAFQAGMEIRPGWDLLAMPLVGAAWEPFQPLRLEIAVPRSRALLYLGPATLIGAIEWRNLTYAMSGDDGDPDDFTMDDLLMSAGVRFKFSDELHLGAELGSFLNRTLTAEGGAGKGEIDLDNSIFVRLSVGGPL